MQDWPQLFATRSTLLCTQALASVRYVFSTFTVRGLRTFGVISQENGSNKGWTSDTNVK